MLIKDGEDIMTEAVIVALITGGLAMLSNVIVVFANNSKTLYRIEQLEKKMEKHNSLQDRIVKLEMNDKAQWQWIDEFKEKI